MQIYFYSHKIKQASLFLFLSEINGAELCVSLSQNVL